MSESPVPRVYARIAGTGSYLPAKVLTNDDLAKFVDTSDEWIAARTGIRQRHVAAEGETTGDLAVHAALRALEAAGTDASEIELIVVGTTTPDLVFPSTACLVQARLGIAGCPAFDVNAACSGFIFALSVAEKFIASGSVKTALVIGSETLTRMVDWSERTTCVLFGDGAGAVVVEAVPAGFGIRSMVMGADGSGAHHLHRKAVGKCLPNGEPLADSLYMNGREVYKFAVRVMNTATIEAVEKAGMTTEDISLFVPHQANLRIIEAARERLRLDPERVIVTVDEYGNNSTASIPLALRHALDGGRIAAGDNLLLVTFGAGLSWASSVLTWGPR